MIGAVIDTLDWHAFPFVVRNCDESVDTNACHYYFIKWLFFHYFIVTTLTNIVDTNPYHYFFMINAPIDILD